MAARLSFSSFAERRERRISPDACGSRIRVFMRTASGRLPTIAGELTYIGAEGRGRRDIAGTAAWVARDRMDFVAGCMGSASRGWRFWTGETVCVVWACAPDVLREDTSDTDAGLTVRN